MWTIRKKIFYVLYKISSSWMPISQRSIIAKKLRRFWAKRIVSYCGKEINIERKAVFGPELSIGDYSGIGINCEIYGPVIIGKNVMMGPEVVIYTSNHNYARMDIPMREQGFTEEKTVVIDDDVWIGRRVIILPGVRIGKGSIIGAAAVVTHDVDEYSIVAGIPAKRIKYRYE